MQERTYKNVLGETYTVRVELDQGEKLNRAILRLANRARSNTSRSATALGGAIKVTIVHDTRSAKVKS